MYEQIGAAIDDKYIEELKKQVIHWDSIKEMGSKLKIVYTPLHGTNKAAIAFFKTKEIISLSCCFKTKNLMTELRENPPKEIDGHKVLSFRDYQADTVKDIETGENPVSTSISPTL